MRVIGGRHVEPSYNVILSEAKNLESFPDGFRENKSEMFRFAQHDSAVE
jgi:hypothetical protein